MNERPDEQQRLGNALAQALNARAEEVTATPSDDARTRVDRRIRQRVRTRRTRRTLVAATSAIAVVTLAVSAVALSGNGDGNADLATDDGDSATIPTTPAPPVLRLGESGDDPADFGLPRIGFAEPLGLTTEPPTSAVVATDEIGPSNFGYRQIQVFRRPGAAVPVIYGPWPSEESPEEPLLEGSSGSPVQVGDGEGLLHGEESGWVRLTWVLPDGTDGRLFAYGVETDALLRFAANLRADPDGVGYEAARPPEGFVAETLVSPASETVGAIYELTFDRDVVQVKLTVQYDSRERQEERLIAALSSGTTGEELEVMGQAGVLVHYATNQVWTIAWPPADGVTAYLVITGGATREQVDDIVDGLRVVNADDWAAELAGG